MNRFKIGSTHFFSDYPDFKSKDLDELVLVDNLPYRVCNVRGKGNDIFYGKRMPKKQFIDLHCERGLKDPMIVGKFLNGDFCKAIGFTIEDLKIFENMFNNMDDKHKYEKIIYDSYIENGDFYLTDLQRAVAYEEYKKYRNEVIH